MLREQGDELHLLSAISPAWVRPGQSIVVRRAPTDFGDVNFTLHFVSPTRARLDLETHFFRAPKRLVLHLPWFMRMTSVTADGRAATIHDDEVDLPAATRSVEIEWTKKPGTERLDFKAAVAKYEAEYREHWRRFLRDGTP